MYNFGSVADDRTWLKVRLPFLLYCILTIVLPCLYANKNELAFHPIHALSIVG